MLELLKHGAHVATGEDVARQKQHGQAIDRGGSRARDHVRRSGTDRADTGEGAEAIAHLGERHRDMHRGLLVLRQVIATLRILLQRLPDARDAPVTEDAQATGEERLTPAVTFDLLAKEESNDSLGGG